LVVAAPLDSESAPAGMPIAELPAKVPDEVCPGEVPSAALPLSFAKLVSRPNVAWLGVPDVSVVVGETVVVVVLISVVPVPDVPPGVFAAFVADASDGEETRPSCVFVVDVVRPLLVVVVPALEVEHVLPPVPAHPPVTRRGPLLVVPVVAVVLVATPELVAAVVPLVVIAVDDWGAGRAVEVVVVVMLPAAANAPLAVSESTSAAATWAGESVFMSLLLAIDRFLVRSRGTGDVCLPP
jgi:hypothetical protein